MAVVLVAVVATVVWPSRPAAALTVFYERTDRTFDGVTLRTRGRINDACLMFPVECVQVNLRNKVPKPKAAPEATAQTKAIRALNFRHAELAPRVGDEGARFDPVQWEVGPRGGWRVDIVVDPALGDPSPKPTILEVKRWAGPATRTDVDAQLEGYRTKGGNVGVTFERNGELNDDAWAERYWFRGAEWCVWADSDAQNHAGNVYFAPVRVTPIVCPLTPVTSPRRATEEEWQKTAVANAKKHGAWTQAAIDREFARIREELEDELEGIVAAAQETPVAQTPVIEPPVQYTLTRRARWNVTVPQNNREEATLKFSFEDGSDPEVRTVPRGSGVVTFEFVKWFPFGVDLYEQEAVVIAEDGTQRGRAQAYTIHICYQGVHK